MKITSGIFLFLHFSFFPTCVWLALKITYLWKLSCTCLRNKGSSQHISGVHLTFECKFRKEYHELHALWGEAVCRSLPPTVALFNSIAVSLIFLQSCFPHHYKTSLWGTQDAPMKLISYDFLFCPREWIHLSPLCVGCQKPFPFIWKHCIFSKRKNGSLYWRTSRKRISCFLSHSPGWKLCQARAFQHTGQDHLLRMGLHYNFI